MKVLFVQTSIGSSDKASFSQGIASIAAVLKKNGHKINLFSFDEWLEDKKAFLYRMDYFKPQIVAFSALSSTFFAVNKIASLVKKNDKGIITICGGVHVTLFPESLHQAKYIDAICRGEGEYCLLNFIDKLTKEKKLKKIDGWWVRNNNKIYKSDKVCYVKDIDLLPNPEREIFLREDKLWRTDSTGKSIEFMLSRGCPYNCAYCSNHALRRVYGSGYVRFKNPKKAIKEIDKVVRKYRTNLITFHDDTFTINKKWFSDFLDLYREKIAIPFSCNIRVDACTEADLIKLKNSGCIEIKIGLESGDEQIRREVLRRNMSNDQIKQFFLFANKLGLNTFAFVMVGFPEENYFRFLETVKLVAAIKPDNYALYVFHPYPGTQLYKVCKNKNLINKKMINSFSFKERTSSILKLKHFSKKDIIFAYKNFQLLYNLHSKDKVSYLKGIHRSLIRKIFYYPPSSSFYLIFRVIYMADKIFLFCVRKLVNFIKTILPNFFTFS